MLMLMKSLVNKIEYGKARDSSIKKAKNEASRAALHELQIEYPNADI